jgi:hypothetical protein
LIKRRATDNRDPERDGFSGETTILLSSIGFPMVAKGRELFSLSKMMIMLYKELPIY